MATGAGCCGFDVVEISRFVSVSLRRHRHLFCVVQRAAIDGRRHTDGTMAGRQVDTPRNGSTRSDDRKL